MLFAASLNLAGCSSVAPVERPTTEAELNDPLEPFNRAMFGFNWIIDHTIFEPLVGAYDFLVPDLMKDRLHDCVENYLSPLSMINSLFQGDGDKFLVHTARFVINTIFGLGGLFDVCSLVGLTARPETFGDTLKVWGLEPGCFLIIPILGPLGSRDFFGQMMDWVMHPFDWFLWEASTLSFYGEKGVEYVDARLKFSGVGNAIEQSFADPYIIVRNAYFEKRGCKSPNKVLPRPLAPPPPQAPKAAPVSPCVTRNPFPVHPTLRAPMNKSPAEKQNPSSEPAKKAAPVKPQGNVHQVPTKPAGHSAQTGIGWQWKVTLAGNALEIHSSLSPFASCSPFALPASLAASAFVAETCRALSQPTI